MIKLTKTDKTILSLVEYNPTITEKKLAESCHLSKDSIRYRLRRLEKEGVIKGYSVLIDYKKLGYESYKLYLKLNCTLNQKEEIQKFFLEIPNTFSLFESFGNWDLAVALFAKNHEEYNKIENQLLEKFGDIVNEKKFCTMIDAVLLERQRLLDEEVDSIKIHKIWGEKKEIELDETNKKLLKMLHENSREKYVFLSDELDLSIDAIKNRLLKLKELMPIKTTKINYELLEFDKYKMFIYPEFFSDKIEKEIISFLTNRKETLNIIRTIGEWKLEVEFLATKYADIEKIFFELNERFSKYILKADISVFRNEKILECKKLIFE